MDSTQDWKKFSNGKTPSTVRLDDLFFRYIKKGTRVLEYGCAWGRIAFQLQKKGYNVVGFDVNEAEVERAKEFAKESNKKNKAQVGFDVADGTNLLYKDDSFDACIVQAFMTALIDPEHRERCLDEARRVLKPGGIIYLGVFGQTWDHPKYKVRYEQSYPITKEKGTFIVTVDGEVGSPEIYRAHHYSKEELKRLVKPRFEIEEYKETTFNTYHKNKAKGFVVIGKKR